MTAPMTKPPENHKDPDKVNKWCTSPNYLITREELQNQQLYADNAHLKEEQPLNVNGKGEKTSPKVMTNLKG